jgi:hypothetical protein
MEVTVDPIAISEMEDLDNDSDTEGNLHQDEYGPKIPEDPSMLHADGELHDLNDSDQVTDLNEQLKLKRQELKAGELEKYEGRKTEWGGGGRSRLLYDQVRVNLAAEHHAGQNNMTWTEQHEEAMQVVKIVAIKKGIRPIR